MNLLFAFFSTFVATATANCNPNGQPNNGQCEEYGGQCSKAADIFLNQIGNFNSKAPQNVLSYGRYCGASTKCPGKGKDVEVCDGNFFDGDKLVNFLDTACEAHDSCLGSLDQIKGFEGRTLEQCACDATLLGSLLIAASTPGIAPTDELCDEDFYNKAAVTNLLDPTGDDIPYSVFLSAFQGLDKSPEAILLAAPFCGLFAGGVCSSLPVPSEVTQFCTTLIGTLTSL